MRATIVYVLFDKYRFTKNECEKTREIDKSDTRVKFNKKGKVSFNVETEKKKIKLKQET